MGVGVSVCFCVWPSLRMGSRIETIDFRSSVENSVDLSGPPKITVTSLLLRLGLKTKKKAKNGSMRSSE